MPWGERIKLVVKKAERCWLLPLSSQHFHCWQFLTAFNCHACAHYKPWYIQTVGAAVSDEKKIHDGLAKFLKRPDGLRENFDPTINLDYVVIVHSKRENPFCPDCLDYYDVQCSCGKIQANRLAKQIINCWQLFDFLRLYIAAMWQSGHHVIWGMFCVPASMLLFHWQTVDCLFICMYNYRDYILKSIKTTKRHVVYIRRMLRSLAHHL